MTGGCFLVPPTIDVPPHDESNKKKKKGGKGKRGRDLEETEKQEREKERAAIARRALTFTATHWFWCMRRFELSSSSGTPPPLVRCVLPVGSITTVLVCPALHGLAVELAPEVTQLPCDVPPEVLVGEHPLLHWAVWWWTPPQAGVMEDGGAADEPPRKKARAATTRIRETAGEEEDSGESLCLLDVLRSVDEEDVSRSIVKPTAEEEEEQRSSHTHILFGRWVSMIYQSFVFSGLPEPHCVDEKTFRYLMEMKEEGEEEKGSGTPRS